MASILMEEKAVCPACQEESRFHAYRFIDAQLDPQLVEMLLDNSLFGWKCPDCEDARIVYYDTTIHDAARSYIIELDSESTERQRPLSGQLSALPSRNRLRLVRSMRELKEKLRLFNDGLDDRAMEAYKCFLLTTMDRTESEEDLPEQFFYEESDRENFMLRAYKDDRSLGLFSVPKTVYHAMEEDIQNGVPNAPDDELIRVDAAYAVALMESIPAQDGAGV